MRKIFTIILLVILTSCSELDPETIDTTKEEAVPVNQNRQFLNVEVIASNLTVPWDIVKVDNQFFISERSGRIIHINENREKKEMPLQLSKSIVEEDEGGLLGFLLHPDYEKNSLAYIYHTYREKGRQGNRIVLIKRNENEWVEERELITLPAGNIHNGGRLAIGPDNKLYATVGDAGKNHTAQILKSLAGKILRLNLDGSIPTDNPFADSYIYSYGHRNPQGIVWDEQGKMYSAEHGAIGHDEINLIVPKGNYGWPIIQGDEKKEGMIGPLFHSGNETWAPSGLEYHNGKLYVAALRGQQIRAFDLRSLTSTPVYQNVGRIRDLLVDGDSLYLITNNTDGRGIPDKDDDRLLKLNFE
ncbi:PQQ-dependent sugar dehydrogenase [Calidifontibacillus oryziterrae]|uniref:PQQ-dependent sugar dehydrogenase n=1 Tax=Calidifontibacillus oryziterrae TaxID=1191699 RepID=UPI00030EFD83|nr:PQQ-dependent sugar dehydrogenase [Calidifontibacillus oryziterrae]